MIYVDSKLPVFEAWSSSVFHKYTKNGAGSFFAVVSIGHVIAYVYTVAQYPSFFIACAHSAVGCATRLTGLCSVCCMCSCVVGVVMWRWEMAFIGHVTDFPLLLGLTVKTDHRMTNGMSSLNLVTLFADNLLVARACIPIIISLYIWWSRGLHIIILRLW